jgi:MFS family permease
MRPGWIYFALFSWAASQGRFTSLFLEERLSDEYQIGILLSLKYIISIIIGPIITTWSDQLVKNGYTYGHTLIIGFCAIMTTIFFLCQSIPELQIFQFLDENHMENRFYYFIVIRILYSISQCSIMSILDGMTLEYLILMKKEKKMFGHERMFGAVSWAAVSFSLGIAIDKYDTKVMYLYNLCLLFPFLVSLFWYEATKCSLDTTPALGVEDLTIEKGEGQGHEQQGESNETNISCKPSGHDCDDCSAWDGPGSSILSDVDDSSSFSLYSILLQHLSVSTVVFLLLCTVLSMGTSVVENLIFLLFTNSLGSTNFICGLSVVVTVVFEIPLFFYASQMLEFFGPVIMLAISTMAYSVRVVGYTLIPQSSNWMILFLEPLHGVTFGCLKISSVEFVSQSTPKGYDVTVQGWLSALQNMGSLVGVSLGGYVEEHYGSEVLYRGAASIVTMFLVLFMGVFVYEHSWKINGDSDSKYVELMWIRKTTRESRCRGPAYVKLKSDDEETSVSSQCASD